MPNIELKLSGPGETFNDVYLCIKEALKAQGYDVRITNEYDIGFTLAEYDRMVDQRKAEILDQYKALGQECPIDLDRKHQINFQVEHRPWGG